MRSSDIYQIILVILGIIVTLFLAVFLYREIFPEYKIYQDDFIALQNFRSTYTDEPPPAFSGGVKQIVLEKEDKGPPVIDRCTSCHVALEIPYFSPTEIEKDINGNIVRDPKGNPQLVKNKNYIWDKLAQKIDELKDPQLNEQLSQRGEGGEVKSRLKLAEEYESLKTARVDDQVYDVTKALVMHPLIGKETRPFEYHPLEEYGCTSCHNGNGRGLTTIKAHGPVFDGQYESEFRGYIPQFTEPDPANDPPFAHTFNSKPGPELLFQTQPLFVGNLIEAKCMQCHQTSQDQWQQALAMASNVTQNRTKQVQKLRKALEEDLETLASLLEIKKRIEEGGYFKTVMYLTQRENDYTLSTEERDHLHSQLAFIHQAVPNPYDALKANSALLDRVNQQLEALLGSASLGQILQQEYNQKGIDSIQPFLNSHRQNPQAKGMIFIKQESLNYDQELLGQIHETATSFQSALNDQKTMGALKADVDELTSHYQTGKELYLSQACYACHRIAGFSRGGVGPELTHIGESYPWYIKESIVWPQADLKTSNMPNMRLDHDELEALLAFLLAQTGNNQAMAQTSYKEALLSWEAGRKLPWEKPVEPAQMVNLRYAMTLFAVEGCASCHRLEGYTSDVGFKVERESPSFDLLYQQQAWFKKLFPETLRVGYYDQPLPGSEIVAQLEKHAVEIDERIISNVRQNSILEQIDREHPEAIEALYSEFKYASRAKNHEYETLIQQASDPVKRAQIEKAHRNWQDRVHRVLMMYIQQYGLGRLICPHLNWSGIYRTDEWLMEHFHNPTAHVPRSSMPVFPFDDTKFYALTNMLDRLSILNRNKARMVWENRGFDPAEAFQTHCAQCHGINLEGHGPISEWIYPIPKNLHNADFMRNLTKERAIYSITHGVKGTPMPPWGEFAEDKPNEIQKLSKHKPVLTPHEIQQLVNWLFSFLPGGEIIRAPNDVLKWQYQPEDLLEELKREGGRLKSSPVGSVEDIFNILPAPLGPDRHLYTIQQKYYTPYNIQQGKSFFLLNCAVCHGNEGDGSGVRGQAMQDAKPRILTNLDWINSRDDLRLLRSIKYGVTGTSMVAWGDQTNSLQRLQLAMFIRTLSKEQDQHRMLNVRLYQAFTTALFTIDDARVKLTKALESLGEEEKQHQERRVDLENQVMLGSLSPTDALKAYQQALVLGPRIRSLQARNLQLTKLKSEIEHERNCYQNLGAALINKGGGDALLNSYLALLQINDGRYAFDGNHLTLRNLENDRIHIRFLSEKIMKEIEKNIGELKENKVLLTRQSAALQDAEELKALDIEISAFQKLKGELISQIEEALRAASKQKEMVDALNTDIELNIDNRIEEVNHDSHL